MTTEEAERRVGKRYRIESSAGAGGMGAVFAAHDTVLNRRVAIKLLHARASAGGVAGVGGVVVGAEHARLLAEARAMAGLNHPNICRVLEISLEGASPFMVMEWIEGITLREAWRGTERRERLNLFTKVVQAAAAAHNAGLVHRDLKPGNVLVDRRGEPVIVDFGLARTAYDARETVAGTPAYAAPEQLASGEVIGPASDVYALGVMLFELLTDRLPFAAESISKLAAMKREQEAPLPESVVPGLPWPLQRICLAAMERDPALRYADAHAMLMDLQRHLRGEAVAARPTQLAREFTEQIEHHIAHSESWQRQGLITEPEAHRLQRLLHLFLRPESHWILESRRLSVSQVSLYLGGWIMLVALTVGIALSWHQMADLNLRWLRGSIGAAVGVIMLVAGVRLHRRDESRVSLGFLMTACLAAPIAVWLLLAEKEWLAPAAEAWTHEWLEVFNQPRVPGLANRELLTIALLWLAVSTGLRWFIRSSAFTPFVALAAVLAWAAGWASAGMLADEPRAMVMLGGWIAAFGVLALPIGLRLNRNEERHEREFGRTRLRTRDSWSVLLLALLAVAGGLGLAAWHAPAWLLGDDHDRLIAARAGLFIVNGIVLQVIAYVLERSKTLVRTRMAELVRWITPQHFLGALLVLEVDAFHNAARPAEAWLWLGALYAGAIGMSYLSVLKQWRPFLMTGLLYLAVAYARTFALIEREAQLEDGTMAAWHEPAFVGLALAGLLAGFLIMLAAWKLPGRRGEE